MANCTGRRLSLSSMAFQPLIAQADAPHFFKIIQPQIVQDGRLRIPKRFVAKYAKELSDCVYLKVPNGEMWMVKMTISNGEVWLQDGWKQFTDHYSIGLWHFLVFRYEGNSHFHVLIFDMSASEIEYPSPKNIHEERADLDGESKMKRKGVMDEDNIKSKKTRSNSEYKEMKHVRTEEDPHLFDFVKEIGDGASRSMTNTHEVLHQAEKRRMASEIEKARALQFTSENPFFIATMRPSYLKVNLTVPRSFMKRYFSKKDEAIVSVTLRVLDGRTWPVSCVNNMKRLSKGWLTFASDNYLELGDICIFELIKGRENFLNVVIFRARKDAN